MTETQAFWTNSIATLYQADARTIPLPDQSVHCVVTSPPYYGLRVYRSDSDAMIGLEPTVHDWMDSMMAVMAEVKRVLRDDGTLWCNLGDSYDGGQLLLIPSRFAIAMQDAGWILRSDVIWAKKAPMPESLAGTRWERCRVKVGMRQTGQIPGGWRGDSNPEKMGRRGQDEGIADLTDCPGCDKCADSGGYVLRNGSWRPTSSFEHTFMFTKKMNYWSDGISVQLPSGANRRNVWNDISPENYGGEHYATFPPDLPRICIQASTSEAGVCGDCCSQWARVLGAGETTGRTSKNGLGNGELAASLRFGDVTTHTLSWRPTCQCNAPTIPATVLDPFAGTGTTLLAAMRLGRRSYGTDLSEDYLGQAVTRLASQTMPFAMTQAQ